MERPLVSVEEVLFLHAVAVTEFGGTHAIRDRAVLEEAVARPLTSFGSAAVFATPWQRAAALLEVLAVRRPFVDGNLRTAALAGAYSLEREGWRLETEDGELAELIDGVAEERIALEEAAGWLQRHAAPIDEG